MVSNKCRIVASLIVMAGLLLAPVTWGERYPTYCRASATTDSITVVESHADHSFAQQITFTLQATSSAEINQVYLFFRATGSEQPKHEAATFEPGREISVNHVHDLRLSPLPPFATVTFWWQIDDAAGNQLITDHQTFEYTDDRFYWEQLNADNVTVHWTEGHGDLAFGQAALDISQASLVKIGEELDAPAPESIDIYIYDSQNNLDAAMMLAGRDWAAGQAHPELGVILIAVPHRDGYTSTMRRYIPHEITHLLVYQKVAPASYRYVPTWLDEGLATANEQLPTPEYTVVLQEAHAQGRLLSLKDLCVPFSPNSQDAFLSYAQSGSVVRFIRDQYGAPAIRAMLEAYADGASCTGGVQSALGINLSGLEAAWKSSLAPLPLWRVWTEQIGIWAGLWLLSLLVAIPMIGGFRRRRRQ